ncbi:uncharacterized protein LOC123550067 [Mercenaria mercenaria]|uniref:uncharacterized protein LOC123550067 n=1 Tax=Mercenaria mercenaria TaxID=6596 RepID=UPI00234F93D6|nr:uncharacterized protein LOC123550067 [Mercenaria mercenaria]
MISKMTDQIQTKFIVVVIFVVLYFISFWLLTIGYFTPYWLLIDLSSGDFDNDWNADHLSDRLGDYNCSSIGLVKPTYNCDVFVLDWFEQRNEHGITRILGNTFILMTTAVVVVYTNSLMLITTVVFDLFGQSLYMSLLSISLGVFYPIAALLTLVGSIYVETSYMSDTGFSAMLCTTAGSLMLIVYTGFILYDQKYIKHDRLSNVKVQKCKHISSNANRRSQTTTSAFVRK